MFVKSCLFVTASPQGMLYQTYTCSNDIVINVVIEGVSATLEVVGLSCISWNRAAPALEPLLNWVDKDCHALNRSDAGVSAGPHHMVLPQRDGNTTSRCHKASLSVEL